MSKDIVVSIKTSFNGFTKAYPVCEISKIFAKIASSKSLSKDTLKYISELGYDIKIQSIMGPRLK